MTTVKELFNDPNWIPECITIDISGGTSRTFIKVDGRIDRTKDTEGKFIYSVRHSDNDDSIYSTIELNILVNRAFDIISDFPLEIYRKDDFITIIDWDIEEFGEYPTYISEGLFFLKMKNENTAIYQYPEIHGNWQLEAQNVGGKLVCSYCEGDHLIGRTLIPVNESDFLKYHPGYTLESLLHIKPRGFFNNFNH